MFKETKYFHYIRLVQSRPFTRTPATYEKYNYGWQCLGHYYFMHILSLSDLCLVEKKEIFKEIIDIYSPIIRLFISLTFLGIKHVTNSIYPSCIFIIILLLLSLPEMKAHENLNFLIASCPSSTFSSAQEPQGQFQSNLTQSILG